MKGQPAGFQRTGLEGGTAGRGSPTLTFPEKKVNVEHFFSQMEGCVESGTDIGKVPLEL